ncbi:ThuA domain-containing protein [Arthrobacter sp. NPDC056691]|uniref:ThuA domain-containing protein n=1 Tax=unclassified Arthrobacter TaxID=235627 RepID=UPI00366AB21D
MSGPGAAGPDGNRPAALLLTGTGRYADPWHPFPETTAALARLLTEAGIEVRVAGDVDDALARLDPADLWPDLLAVNVGLPRDGRASPGTAAAMRGLERWAAAGRALLACHVSATSFVDCPAWEDALGGRWVRGVSMHPEYGAAKILVQRDSGPLAEGIPDFELDDERYSWLRTGADINVHAVHLHDGTSHPLLWSRAAGSSRTFYDALGHDAASFNSPEHLEILRRAIAWLVPDAGTLQPLRTR